MVYSFTSFAVGGCSLCDFFHWRLLIILDIKQVLINNLKIKIPNGFEYPADVRSETFISI